LAQGTSSPPKAGFPTWLGADAWELSEQVQFEELKATISEREI